MATPVLLRYNNDYKFPATDAQFVQYNNANLNEYTSIIENVTTNTVENVKDALEALDNRIGDIYIVTFKFNNGTITCNRTYTEILAAWNSKKIVLGKITSADSVNNNTDWFNLDNFNPNVLVCHYAPDYKEEPIFSFTTINEKPNGAIYVINIHLNNTNDTTFSFDEIALLHSPYFTGTPTAPTATAGTNSTQIATTAFVNTAVNTAVNNLAKTQGVAYCTTAAATAAKTATLSNYDLYTGGIVSVWFQYNVPANATLNINSKGDKQIRLITTSSTSVQISANYIHAGDIATFIYDGSYYQLIGLNDEERVTATATVDEEFYFIGVSTSGGNSSNQQPKFNEGVYMNRYNQLVASQIKEGNTLLSDKYAPRLRYVLKAPSSSAISFTSTSTMLPDRVYVVGTYPNLQVINSLSIGENALDVTGYGYFAGGSTGSCPTNNSLVPTYQIVFKASTTFSSITLPSNVKWRDNYAPAATDMRGKVCELTIMNGIATMNMITV